MTKPDCQQVDDAFQQVSDARRLISRREFVALTGLTTASILLAGCGGGGGDTVTISGGSTSTSTSGSSGTSTTI